MQSRLTHADRTENVITCRVNLGPGKDEDIPFHITWLRDNCQCVTCRHPTTGELAFDQLTLDEDACRVSGIDATPNGELDVRWSDGHRSRFAPDWLREHRYDRRRGGVVLPAARIWTNKLRDTLPVLDFAEVTTRSGMLRLLTTYFELGFAILRGASSARDTIVDLAGEIAFVLPSNFGFTYDIVSKIDAASNAHTALGLFPHTDLPHHRRPPGVQLLHCRENEARGGESLLVDGFAIAEELRVKAPDDFSTLTTVPIAFRYFDVHGDYRFSAPIIQSGCDGDVESLRFAPNVLAPMNVPFADFLRTREAYRAFASMVADEKFLISFRLEPGDILVNNNLRILHGRTAFDPGTGMRLLQGCYMDESELASRFTLERGRSIVSSTA